jgi:lipoprotein-releasing system ATP-binding protein
MAEPEVLLKLEGVSKDYAGHEGSPPVRVLREIRLEVAAGDSLAIIGPSGSGKSTLLHIMGSLDQATSGRVWLEGTELGSLSADELAAVRNRRIGFVFQSHHLLPHCSALENVLVPTLAEPLDGPTGARAEGGEAGTHEPAAARAQRLLERVGLGDRLHHRPGQLSGGERQRVAVVRALINRPGVLLADEPTGALDRAAAAELSRLLVELNREERVTLIVVTHALDLARQMGWVMELKEGTLRAVDWEANPPGR